MCQKEKQCCMSSPKLLKGGNGCVCTPSRCAIWVREPLFVIDSVYLFLLPVNHIQRHVTDVSNSSVSYTRICLYFGETQKQESSMNGSISVSQLSLSSGNSSPTKDGVIPCNEFTWDDSGILKDCGIFPKQSNVFL